LKMFEILNLSLFFEWASGYMMKVVNSMMCIQLSQILHQGTFGPFKDFRLTLWVDIGKISQY
jgi:hypothetical protein